LAIAVGRLVRDKRLDVVLRGLADMTREAAAILVGEGPDERRLSALAGKLRLGERVRFLGKRSDMPQLYRASDVYIAATRREGLSLAALEAMASGLPLVVPDLPEFAELVRGPDNGLVYPYGDWRALAKALDRLQRDPAHCRDLGARSRELAAAFSWETMAGQTLGVYEELLA
ncbi:MAG: glycosyltransferase family 4 protein, partial [Cyanobacteria bacterium REEB65]|nr:glycosyltransferase family 4 protein [Cyanobacteria bacterium REEB65]